MMDSMIFSFRANGIILGAQFVDWSKVFLQGKNDPELNNTLIVLIPNVPNHNVFFSFNLSVSVRFFISW